MKFLRIISVVLLWCYHAEAKILPARIFSDHMVLQREVAIPLWGTADPGEQLILQLGTSKAETITLPDGSWNVNLPALPAGGPYILKIQGSSDSVEFKEILIGDVWFASGQSNMEHPMEGWEYIPHSAVDRYEQELIDSDYPQIRLFSVPKYPSPVEQKDLLQGKWEVASPESVAPFSSTAWFFGKELYKKIKVPIGIIHSSWGGTSIQPWMSRESLAPYKSAVNIPAVPQEFDQTKWSEKVDRSLEMLLIRRNQISWPVAGLSQQISQADYDDSAWKSVDIFNENTRFGNIAWLRKKIVIHEALLGQTLRLSLGFLSRQSYVYFNGTELGYFLYPQPAELEIPQSLVHSGENILSIRVSQPWGETQVFGAKEQFYLANANGSFTLNLGDGWKANDKLEPLIPVAESYHGNPTFLFNGMVSPVVPYALKGFIWYQGESNVAQAEVYEKMFQQLIVDWRKHWNQDNLPFLFVQLSNLELSHRLDQKSDSWCLLREAQQKALSLPATGMAVSLDMGNPYDIHPKNKQEFGHRLALQALKIAYHQDVVADGPSFQSIAIVGDTIVLKDATAPLMAKNPGNLTGFEIADRDGVFQQAKAWLKGKTVYVVAEQLKHPQAVRYAWNNNPTCSLFNNEGLPMAPFRSEKR